MGSYPVVQCLRCLMGQPFSPSAADAGVWGGRAFGDGSAVLPCFHGCLAYLHSHFPPQAPPSHPLCLSLPSQLQPSPWDCSTVSKLQLPAPAPSREPVSLSRICMAVARTVILILFRLPQVSWFSLSVKYFYCNSDNCPDVGIGPLLQFPHQARAGPVLLTLLCFPLVPLSY